MKIAGVQKTSFIDFPGELSTVLFTAGCNLRCPYCHNAELLSDANLNESQDWIEWLNKRKKNISAVVISGGEPTLQKDLVEFLVDLKSGGFKVKLDTNGTNPDVIEEIIEKKLIDYIAMDLKGPKETYLEFSRNEFIWNNIQNSIKLIIEKAPDYEFRTTVTKELISDYDFTSCTDLIKNSKRLYIQNFKDGDQVLAGRGNLNSATKDQLDFLKENFEKEVKQVKIR